MKRRKSATLLVDYSSSDSGSEKTSEGFSQVPSPAGSKPLSKKRKLPPLSTSLLPDIPQDNPALHQGRIRTTPHVEGQFAAHIYVSITISRHSTLFSLLHDAFQYAKLTVPTLHPVGAFVPTSDDAVSQRLELHVSLSRPVYLRAHQGEEVRRTVRGLAREHKRFPISFATFCELINDEKTRTFLALEIGAGHHELRALTEALAPSLRAIRQKEYYDKPRFHVSIGWALLDHPEPQTIAESLREDFPTIHCIPSTLIQELNERHAPHLASTKVGLLEAEEVCIKIGKQVTSWALSGE